MRYVVAGFLNKSGTLYIHFTMHSAIAYTTANAIHIILIAIMAMNVGIK